MEESGRSLRCRGSGVPSPQRACNWVANQARGLSRRRARGAVYRGGPWMRESRSRVLGWSCRRFFLPGKTARCLASAATRTVRRASSRSGRKTYFTRGTSLGPSGAEFGGKCDERSQPRKRVLKTQHIEIIDVREKAGLGSGLDKAANEAICERVEDGGRKKSLRRRAGVLVRVLWEWGSLNRRKRRSRRIWAALQAFSVSGPM